MTARAAACLLAALAPLLTGCIAAVVPLAAGAALANRQDPKARAARLDAAAEAASKAAPSAPDNPRIVRTTLTALPPPDSVASSGNPAVPGFRSYALALAEVAPGVGKRESAIIPDAGDLRLVRSDCGMQPAAVFIDLDPGRGTFDPLAPGIADPVLAAALAELRARDVTVVWFSRLGANFTAAARATLTGSGLDPDGADELMLLRDLHERKQTLRDEVAKRLCPIAILGDERADFDELYLYLKNPDAAVALDAMIDRGWFLAAPFRMAGQGDAGATP